MERQILSLLLLLCLGVGYPQQSSGVDLNLVDKAFNYMDPVYSSSTSRAAGMAGAMGALGADPTAVDVNPAGAGLFINGEVSFSLGFDNWNNKSIFNSSLNNKDTNIKLGQIGGVMSINPKNENWKKVNLGISYSRNPYRPEINFSANRNLSLPDYDANGDTTYDYEYDGYSYVSDGTRDKLAFFIGSNYNNKLYLGAAFNFHSYDVRYNPIVDAYLPETSEAYDFDAFNNPYDELASGVSFAAGIIYRPVPIFRFGLAYQSPIGFGDIATNYKDYAFNTDGSVNESILDGYWEEDDATGPGFFSLSSALVLNQNWAINIDYIHTFNSNLKYKPTSYYNDTNQFIDDFVKNTSEFRIGSEYILKSWSFRAGYSHKSSPISGFSLAEGYTNSNGVVENKEIENLWAGVRSKFTAGVGYDFGKLNLDLAYIRSQSDYNILMYGEFVDPGFFPIYIPNYLGSVKNTSNNFMIGMHYTF